MGFVSRDDYFGWTLAASFFEVLFLGWVLSFVSKTVSTIAKAQNNARSRALSLARKDEVLCPCIFKRLSVNTLQFTMRCTLVSVALFFGSAVVCIVWVPVFLAMRSHKPVFQLLDTLNIVLWVLGYLLMFVTHFERLRMTFSGSMMRLPKWTPNLLYAALLIGMLLLTCANLPMTSWPVSAACLTLLALFYSVSVSALIRAFYKKTMTIANISQGGGGLVKTAVRITISVTVSLFSTTAMFLSWAVVFMLCPKCMFWRLVAQLLLKFDICLNAFCLMCTFSLAESHYKRLFGRLDHYFLARVSRQSIDERTVLSTFDAIDIDNELPATATLH